jgi:prolyl-tRNA synthetase
MRMSKYFIPTLKEMPSEAVLASHQLMLRAGLISKEAAGMYLWLPFGLKALRKVERVIREEMDAAGALEIACSMLVPRKLFEETGRWARYGDEMFRLKDRKESEFCLGPTHEEVFTDLVRSNLSSYRDFPVTLYQIGKKYRDEIRPRFGVMRGREFLMKDAYSFDVSEEGLKASYQAMYQAYRRIFDRLRLGYTVVAADSGAIGGEVSFEFMVKSDVGEAEIVVCPKDGCGYAANVEKARGVDVPQPGSPLEGPRREVATPGVRKIEDLAAVLKVHQARIVKTLIYQADDQLVAVLLRGDHELNEVKLTNLLSAHQLRPAAEEEIREATGGPSGFSGPMGLNPAVRLVSDLAVRGMGKTVIGANRADLHVVGVTPGTDFSLPTVADLRRAVAGDPCPGCRTGIQIIRGIEVGHVFQLGTAYSAKMGASFTDAGGARKPLVMGCYGIGVDRTLASIIEQNHDERGIRWPMVAAPFQVAVVPINMNDESVVRTAEELYGQLASAGLDVLLDDRDQRAGFKFKDSELLGTPIRITVSTKTVADAQVEWTLRRDLVNRRVNIAAVVDEVKAAVAAQGAAARGGERA